MSFNSRSLTLASTVALASGFALPSVCQADIFGLFWQDYDYTQAPDDFGSTPFVDDDYIQLTTGKGQRRSIFFYEPQNISRFTASFTYRAENPQGCSSGLCFVIQNSTVGTKALGETYGYSGIEKSAAVTIEIVSSRSGYYTNGNLGGGSDSTWPVDINLGNDINVSLEYDGSLLYVRMTDTVTGDVYSPPARVIVPSLTDLVENDVAFVGFTATSGTNCFSGGINHHLSNFRFFTEGCPADFNEDGVSDSRDVVAFLNAWTSGDSSADFNGDGTVNTIDVTAFLNAWIIGC